MTVMLFFIFASLNPNYVGDIDIPAMLFIYAFMFDVAFLLAIGKKA